MKLYVLVRKDLGPIYGSVQGGHAIAQYMLEHGEWQNETLVYLGVKNEQHLKKWKYKLDKLNADYSYFIEPDIDDQLTSIATCKNIFKSLNCL